MARVEEKKEGIESIDLKECLRLESGLIDDLIEEIQKAMKEGKKSYRTFLKRMYQQAHWSINYKDSIQRTNETVAKLSLAEKVTIAERSPLDIIFLLRCFQNDIDSDLGKCERGSIR